MKKYLAAAVLLAAMCLASCGGSSGGDDPVKVTVPAVPSSVALHGTPTQTSLTFQWMAVTGATSYGYRLVEGSREVESSSVTTRNVTINDLTAGTTYKFAVRAENEAGASDWSAYVEAATAGGNEEPDDPVDPNPAKIAYEDFGIPAVEEDGVARAFPGAEGGGMYATGGRGGKVLHVTTLEDNSNEGSLRWAITQGGARTIVFDVAGIIELKSALRISNGDITIAGQTAPGDGICLKNYTLNVNADNVIIRFLHFRLGDQGPNAGDGEDCLWGRYHDNVIIDHCSMSWSIDECASFYANSNFTLQWCILTESMNNSAHSKGAHGYGGIWGGSNASFHHTLLANHHSRNPRIDHPEIYPSSGGTFDWSKRGNVDIRNLVVYNWGDNSSYGGEGGKFNFVNCYYKPGPDSKDRHYFVDAYRDYTRSDKTTVNYGYPSLYMSGNQHTKYTDITDDNSKGIYWHNGSTGTLAENAHPIKGPMDETSYVTTHSTIEGMETVLGYAGDCLHRDAVDQRAVNGVRNNTGKIIDTPGDVGGWPEYKATDAQLAAVRDADGDGIPDAIEEAWGLSKSSNADGGAFTLDPDKRYTNLEMYLHYLVREIVSAQNSGGKYEAL